MHNGGGRSVGSGSGLWISFHGCRAAEIVRSGRTEAAEGTDFQGGPAYLPRLTVADTAKSAVYTFVIARGLPKGGAASLVPFSARWDFPFLRQDCMGDQGRYRRDQDSPTQADNSAAVRSPSGDSSSSSSDLPAGRAHPGSGFRFQRTHTSVDSSLSFRSPHSGRRRLADAAHGSAGRADARP